MRRQIGEGTIGPDCSEKRVAVSEQRIGDRGLLRPVPPQPHQDDDIRVFQQQQNRVAERRRAQAVPIKAGGFGTQSEFAGQFDEAPSRQAIALDQVAATDSADFGMDAVLRAQPEKAGRRCLGRDGIGGESAAGASVVVKMAMRFNPSGESRRGIVLAEPRILGARAARCKRK